MKYIRNILIGLVLITSLHSSEKPNVLLITADDLGWDSLGCTGNPLEGLSPNLDRLAAEGLLIQHCYIATPICGPSREALYTGQYPQSTGYMGHGEQPPLWWKNQKRKVVKESITSLLHDAGYFTGCVGKHGSKWCKFSTAPAGSNIQTGMGRNPEKYYQFVRDFLNQAKADGKPFYLAANTHDPHRYWARHRSETKQWFDQNMGTKTWQALDNGKPYPDPASQFDPEKCPMPPSYPDAPELRLDLAKYYDSVNRMDKVVGEVLRALKESGLADDTVVMFLSDHGMAWEMSKWCLYPSGTRTPLIVRWPGKINPGLTNETSIISVVDIAPTLANICGLGPLHGSDGESFGSLLQGDSDKWKRAEAFSTFNYMNNLSTADQEFKDYTQNLYKKHDQYRPSRSLSNSQYTYIWNRWSDGTTSLPNTMGNEVAGLLRKQNPKQHSDWLKFAKYRAPEELYDTISDPGCRKNLINDPEYGEQLQHLKEQMLTILKSTQDHELENYRGMLKQ